jgi:small subunit ribosomal protein S8e
VKGAIVQIDATPFKQWYEKHYGTTLGKKKKVSIFLSLPLSLSLSLKIISFNSHQLFVYLIV